MTGTPSSRSCAIKPEESSPRRWKSTSATWGRRPAISFVASAVVAAGPATCAPKSSRCCFRVSEPRPSGANRARCGKRANCWLRFTGGLRKGFDTRDLKEAKALLHCPLITVVTDAPRGHSIFDSNTVAPPEAKFGMSSTIFFHSGVAAICCK